MENHDKLQKIYEDIVAQEHREIEEKNPDIIEEMIKRIKALEEKVILLEGK